MLKNLCLNTLWTGQNIKVAKCVPCLHHLDFVKTSELWNNALRTASTNLYHGRHSSTDSSSSGRKKLIILGTGWGSYAVLKNINKKKYDVVVISPRNHFLFTPLLCSTTVGTLEFRSIIEPIRNTGFRQTDHFHLSYAFDLDMEKKIVTAESVLKPSLHYNLSYDKLVIGVGALSNTFGVPGVTEHAFFLKEVADARRIRNKILSNFELSIQPGIDEEETKRLLHFVIVGGGPTGIEFGAELYDFVEEKVWDVNPSWVKPNPKEKKQQKVKLKLLPVAPLVGTDLLEDVARLYKQKESEVKVTLVESNQILSTFDESLRNYAEKKIKQRSRFDLVQSVVTEVRADSIVLKDGTVIPCGLVVWSTGVAPRTFTKDLQIPKNKPGQILTDKFLRVLGDKKGDVFAVGDCADIENMPLPCTAQVAEKEGRYLAKQLNSDEKDKKPFEYKSMGMMTYIGKYQALTDVPKVKMQGFPSWLVWRSAYLTRLGSWRLRMQVPLDWTKTLLFGRDISRFE